MPDGIWDVNNFAPYLPDRVVNKILSNHPPPNAIKEDSIIWKLTPSWEFTLNSTIDCLNSDKQVQNDGITNWSYVLMAGPLKSENLYLAHLER